MTSTAKPKQPKPPAAHERLEVFIGAWHAEGTSFGEGQDAADPRATGVPCTSGETWLPLCDRIAVRKVATTCTMEGRP